MRNVFIVLVSAALATGAVFAQETPEGVDRILKELEEHQAAQPAPAAKEPTRVVVENEAAELVEEAGLDVVLEESRDLYVAGKFEEAQKSFERAIQTAPENMIARTYLRRLLERDHRIVEIKGLKEVNEAWDTDLVLRSYPLSSEARENLDLESVADTVDVSLQFPEVPFPKGTLAVYQPKQEKIFVRNTRENLVVLEKVLDSIDATKPSGNVDQVEIEAKFVEVSEGTLEELGFEWRSAAGSDSGAVGDDIRLFDDWSYNGTYHLFDDALRGGPGGPAMPFNRPNDLGRGTDGADAGDWNAFRFEDTFSEDPANVTLQFRGGTPLDILISALDQSTGTDVLSAPRIVTRSGKKAVIRVGELHHYPKEYKVGANQANIIHVTYTGYEEKLLGVELAVTPKINDDQIELGLNPKVTELLGWQNYQVAPKDSSYTTGASSSTGRIQLKFYHDPVVARLPIYKKREIKTSVTIADGGTIGMGGLISEKVEAFEDKVPVLGSIPLVGRLFRNEGERAVKRNLMMFVTARKVEPTGRINTSRSFE